MRQRGVPDRRGIADCGQYDLVYSLPHSLPDLANFWLTESRLQVCQHEADLKRFEPLVQLLADCGGMGIDGSDHQSSSRTSDRKYVIVSPEWRGP